MPQTTTRRRVTSAVRTAKTKTRSVTSRGSGPTKEQLYKQAKRLGIPGRSKMSKSQLQAAVNRRK